MTRTNVTRRAIAVPAAKLRAAQAGVDAHAPPAWDAPDDGDVFTADCGDGYSTSVSLLLEDEGLVVGAALFRDGIEVDSLDNEHRYQIVGDYAFEDEEAGRKFLVSVVEAPPPRRNERAELAEAGDDREWTRNPRLAPAPAPRVDRAAVC